MNLYSNFTIASPLLKLQINDNFVNYYNTIGWTSLKNYRATPF